MLYEVGRAFGPPGRPLYNTVLYKEAGPRNENAPDRNRTCARGLGNRCNRNYEVDILHGDDYDLYVEEHDLKAQAWLASLARQGMAPGTRTKYGAHARLFLNWLGDRDVADVTRRDVEDYLDHWHAAAGPAPGTVRVRLSALKSFFAYLEDRGVIDRNPAARVKPPKSPKKPIDWLRGDDDRAMLDAPITDIEAILVWLLRWTGLRVGEATSLLVSDVDFAAGTIRVRRSKSDAGLRTIPIAPELDIELRRWLDALRRRNLYRPDAPLLCTCHGTPMHGQFIWRVVRRVARRAGVSASPHTLRRTFASHLLNKGARIEVVSKLLGHSDVRVTQAAYAELEDATSRAEFLRVIAS